MYQVSIRPLHTSGHKRFFAVYYMKYSKVPFLLDTLTYVYYIHVIIIIIENTIYLCLCVCVCVQLLSWQPDESLIQRSYSTLSVGSTRSSLTSENPSTLPPEVRVCGYEGVRV